MCLSSLRVHHNLLLMRVHPSLLFIPFCLIEPFLLCLLSGYFYVLSTWFFTLGSRERRAGALNLLVGWRQRRFAWTACAPLQPAVTQVHVPLDLPLSYFSPCCFLPLILCMLCLKQITSWPCVLFRNNCLCSVSASTMQWYQFSRGRIWGKMNSTLWMKVSGQPPHLSLHVLPPPPPSLTLTQARLLYLT